MAFDLASLLLNPLCMTLTATYAPFRLTPSSRTFKTSLSTLAESSIPLSPTINLPRHCRPSIHTVQKEFSDRRKSRMSSAPVAHTRTPGEGAACQVGIPLPNPLHSPPKGSPGFKHGQNRNAIYFLHTVQAQQVPREG